MDKTEKSSKMLDIFLVDFLPILYKKVKNYIQKASIRKYRYHAI